MHTLILSSRMMLIFGLMLAGLATGPISPTTQVTAAPAAPTFTVNSFSDAIASAPLTNGVCETAPGNHICTLRAAIMKANHYAGGGVTINLPAGTYVLTLSSGPDDEMEGDLNITNTMTINGANAASTIIDAGQIDRVLTIMPGVAVILSNVTVRNGYTIGLGGGIANNGTLTLNRSTISNNRAPYDDGGGLYNGGTLTVNDSAVSNNSAQSDGGGIYNFGGTLTLNKSTISNNRAVSRGGGIYNDGTLTLNHGTLSNNSVEAYGGGIYNNAAGTVNAYYGTIAGNLADSDANALGAGGGIYNNGGTANFKGTLLAQNYAAAVSNDCQGVLTSQDYNLIQTTAGCVIYGVTAHNITGVADAFVDSLRNNGGSTPTRALLAGSPAINAIPIAQCTDQFGAPLTADQRGFPRPNGGACDIGAYEGSLPMPLYDRNLIRNGDAEAMAGSPTGATVGLPNWTRITGATLVPYGAPGGFPTATDPGPADRGFGFFAGGVSAPEILTQEIDVSPASIGAAIDAGKVHFALSGYFGGYLTDNDYAYLEVIYLDASHGYIAYSTIGSVFASDRNNQTGLLFKHLTGIVPVGARFMQVNLRMIINNGSYGDGYADNLSLVLWLSKVFLPLVLK